MHNKLKIELNISELESLVLTFSQYPIAEITDRNTRLMVHELLSKLGKKLMGLIMTGGKERIVSFNLGQAAAFDEAFRQTPISQSSYTLGLYEETIINRILNEINKVI